MTEDPRQIQGTKGSLRQQYPPKLPVDDICSSPHLYLETSHLQLLSKILQVLSGHQPAAVTGTLPRSIPRDLPCFKNPTWSFLNILSLLTSQRKLNLTLKMTVEWRWCLLGKMLLPEHKLGRPMPHVKAQVKGFLALKAWRKTWLPSHERQGTDPRNLQLQCHNTSWYGASHDGNKKWHRKCDRLQAMPQWCRLVSSK